MLRLMLHGAVVGLVSAVVVDLHVLVSTGHTRGWRALLDFDWEVATFRWASGAVSGAVAGSGLNV